MQRRRIGRKDQRARGRRRRERGPTQHPPGIVKQEHPQRRELRRGQVALARERWQRALMLDHCADHRVLVPAVAGDDAAQLAERPLAVGAPVEALDHLERDPGVVERAVARSLQNIDREGGGGVGAADDSDRRGDRRLKRGRGVEWLLSFADRSHCLPTTIDDGPRALNDRPSSSVDGRSSDQQNGNAERMFRL